MRIPSILPGFGKPWEHEPDELAWQDEETGLPCSMRRGSTGAWCGYVGVREGHPFFDRHYDECPVDAHGGLTFSSLGIAPAGGQRLVWWLGFDCAHAGDLLPMYPRSGGQYRDVAFVEEECRKLAKRLAAIAG